jgi:two-component system invasion response regulator UvrY
LKIRVLVADDHDLVRHGITRMLADVDDIDVVGEATSGEEALDLCREKAPSVVLMDVKMPGIGGLEATRKLARQHPEIKVVVVTACEDDPFPSKLLKAGAAGFVTKGAGVDEMVTAIHSVIRGQRYISPKIAQQMPASSLAFLEALTIKAFALSCSSLISFFSSLPRLNGLIIDHTKNCQN